MNKTKVLAYIFRNNSGVEELLIFDHKNFPEVNPQVPGGTVDVGEDLEEAILREVFEESGLEFISSDSYLGQYDFCSQNSNEIHKRHIYTFSLNKTKENWIHTVSSGSEDKGLEFCFYWQPVEEARNNLVAEMGKYLPFYRFKPLKEPDLPIIEAWYEEPHIKEFWNISEQWEESYERYILKTASDTVKQYLIYFKNRPIGYIQFYWASKVGEGWWEGYPDDVVGIDQYIGEPELIDKGHGTRMIKEFIDFLCNNHSISKIITDPSPTNIRAIKCYEKCGFKQIGEIDTPDGRELLMVYSP